MTNGSGGDARWGFLVAILIALVAFVGGGLCGIVRLRRDHLGVKVWQALGPPDADDGMARPH